MKKLRNLKVGDELHEGAGHYLTPAGRLAAILEDPQHPGRMYLLATQPDKRLTVYAGDAEGPYIHLARGLPANIFCEWCAIVNNGLSFPEPPPKAALPVVVDAAVPPGEVQLQGPDGELKDKIVNLAPEEEPVPPAADCPLCLVDFP